MSETESHPWGHNWRMTSQEGERCEWECACGAHQTTFDGRA